MKNIKKITTSFMVSFLVLITFSFLGLIFLVNFGGANLNESKFFAVVFLPALFLYSLIYSLAELIYTHTIKYTFFFTSLLSLCSLISMYFHFWLFHWFLIFLIIHYLISILKSKKKTFRKN